jgi:hypothetical protein
MYKELLARLKEQRESLDQSIIMLEEHIRYMGKAPFNPTAEEIFKGTYKDPKEIDYSFDGESVEISKEAMEKFKALGKPDLKYKVDFSDVTITGDPLQHKFMHLAKGIVDKTNERLPQGKTLFYDNPTKDPLAFMFNEYGANPSKSNPINVDHLRYNSLPAKAPQIYEHEDEVYVIFNVIKDKEIIQTHVYDSGSHNTDGAKEFAARQLQILESWVKEELGESLEIKTVYSCPVTKEDFEQQEGVYKEVYIYA